MNTDQLWDFWQGDLDYKTTVINKLLDKHQRGKKLTRGELAILGSGPGMAKLLKAKFHDAAPEFAHVASFSCLNNKFTLHWQAVQNSDWDPCVRVSTVRTFSVPEDIFQALPDHRYGFTSVRVLARIGQLTVLDFSSLFRAHGDIATFPDSVIKSVQGLNSTIALYRDCFDGSISEAELRARILSLV